VNPFVLGESASPFIDKRDGLTGERERERVRLLLSLVAHAVGYKMMVGAHKMLQSKAGRASVYTCTHKTMLNTRSASADWQHHVE